MDELDEPGEVLLPLPRTEVDAEPRAVEVGRRLQARVVDGHPGGGDGEQGVPAVLPPAVGVPNVFAEVALTISAPEIVIKSKPPPLLGLFRFHS